MQRTYYITKDGDLFYYSPNNVRSFISSLKGTEEVARTSQQTSTAANLRGKLIAAIFHVEPEGVTLRYDYADPSNIELTFSGRRSSISSAKKRLDALIARNEK